MFISDKYFDILIGSVTLDIYQPKESGFIYTVDASHGYHRKTVHLATKYPEIRPVERNNILFLFSFNIWIFTLSSVCALSMALMTTIIVYSNISSKLIRNNLSLSQVIMRLFAGITEPDDENWFTTFSTGSLYSNE